MFSLSLDDVISMVDSMVFVLHCCRVIFTKKRIKNLLVGFEFISLLLQLLLTFAEDFCKTGNFYYKDIRCAHSRALKRCLLGTSVVMSFMNPLPQLSFN